MPAKGQIKRRNDYVRHEWWIIYWIDADGIEQSDSTSFGNRSSMALCRKLYKLGVGPYCKLRGLDALHTCGKLRRRPV